MIKWRDAAWRQSKTNSAVCLWLFFILKINFGLYSSRKLTLNISRCCCLTTKTLRMQQTNSLTDINPLNLTDTQQTGARVCRLCCRRSSWCGVVSISAAPLCSCLFHRCCFSAHTIWTLKNLIVHAFTVYIPWLCVSHLRPVSAFMFCSGSVF